ncbi:MAG: thioredoxin family protein [Bacteroidia bacterium]
MIKKMSIYLFLAAMLGTGVVLTGFSGKSDEVVQPQAEQIKWLSIEEAVAAAAKDKKKIVVDVYTDWCGWCKKLDKDTYSQAEVIAYVNRNYHAVKFNAEQKEDITVGGVTYKYINNGRRGYHELAANMLNGRMSYPSTVFFDHQLNIITNVPGYHDAKEMLTILNFLGEDAYKTTSWDTYQKNFKSPR